MTLLIYIEKYYGGSQAAFARAVGVKPPQVTQWIDKKFIVVDHELYSPRRNLPNPGGGHIEKEKAA
ncbi:helix-turn-helix domain-containing protein [Klebsiella sp. Ap-873]|nr:helix-turn-helix domain-containing protein [Klebsiella sp. Ap-874]NIG72565.1 helix-turn-helix domain-containing protein [Klebsiella sp. Ap-873]